VMSQYEQKVEPVVTCGTAYQVRGGGLSLNHTHHCWPIPVPSTTLTTFFAHSQYLLIAAEPYETIAFKGTAPVPSKPFPQNRSRKAVPSKPFPQRRSLKAVPSKPFPRSRSLEAVPSKPFPRSRSLEAVPSKPFPVALPPRMPVNPDTCFYLSRQCQTWKSKTRVVNAPSSRTGRRTRRRLRFRYS
jgi:hypothetical protein